MLMQNKAKSLAKRAGRDLGDVLVMVENGAQQALPSPVFKARSMAMAEGFSADAATVSAGQINVEKRIQVIFSLK